MQECIYAQKHTLTQLHTQRHLPIFGVMIPQYPLLKVMYLTFCCLIFKINLELAIYLNTRYFVIKET